MLDAARASSMTREEATEQAMLYLRRNLRYLARREQRGHQTRYDEVLERDLELKSSTPITPDWQVANFRRMCRSSNRSSSWT